MAKQTIVIASAACSDCDFAQSKQNAVGLGTQHANRTGHWVIMIQQVATSLNSAETEPATLDCLRDALRDAQLASGIGQ